MNLVLLVKRFGVQLGIICVSLVGLSVASMLGPFFLTSLIDSISQRESFQSLAKTFVFLGAANTLIIVISFYQSIAIGSLSIRLSTYLRDRLAADYLGPSGLSTSKGDFVATALTDVATVTSFITHNIASALSYFSSFLGISLVLFSFNRSLYYSVIAFLPLYLLTYRIFGKKRYSIAQKVRTAYGIFTECITEIEHNRWSVIHHGGQSSVRRFLNEKMQGMNRATISQVWFNATSGLIMSSLSFLVTLVTLLLGSRLFYMGTISLGEFVSYLSYASRLISPVASLTGFGLAWQSCKVALERINTISGKPSAHLTSKISGLPDQILFDKVKPYAQSSLIINGALQVSNRTSIMGPTGSGKSTIAELLTGQLTVQEGVVSFVGLQNQKHVECNGGGRAILVSAKMRLFLAMSYLDNMFIHQEQGSEASIGEVLDIVELGELFDSLSSTEPVKRRDLSRGEEQRFLLARALLLCPIILVLDEALSGVEPSLYERIMVRVSQRVPVTVIISHRISDHEGSNLVYHIKDGNILQQTSDSAFVDSN